MSRDPLTREELLLQLNRESARGSANAVLFNQAVAARVGIHPTDLKVLSLLAQQGAMTARQLVEQTGLTAGAMTFTIDRLEKAGYAQRIRTARDRRSILVELCTKRAERDLGQFFTAMERTLEKVGASYTDEQLAMILTFLSQVNEATQQEIARLHNENVLVDGAE